MFACKRINFSNFSYTCSVENKKKWFVHLHTHKQQGFFLLLKKYMWVTIDPSIRRSSFILIFFLNTLIQNLCRLEWLTFQIQLKCYITDNFKRRPIIGHRIKLPNVWIKIRLVYQQFCSSLCYWSLHSFISLFADTITNCVVYYNLCDVIDYGQT